MMSSNQRSWRRIATEESFYIPEVAEAQHVLSKSVWDNLDMRKIERRTSPEAPLYRKLIDLEGERLLVMDQDDVAMQLLSLTTPGVQLFDPHTATRLAALVNDRLAELVSRHPTRFAGLAALAPQDPQGAVKEMERAIKDLKLHGFIINSHTQNEYLDLPKYWPILEAAEALDSAIYLHPRGPADTMAAPLADYGMEGAAWGYQIDAGTHAVRMILSGLFDRFPRLKIVLGHMGETIPFMLWRLDYFSPEGTARRNGKAASTLLPSEVFKRNFWITTSGMEFVPALKYAIEVLGAERIMWAVDYPFMPSAPAASFLDNADISDAERELIYHENAERLFRLPTGIAEATRQGEHCERE
jgi:5-carboxyvanillate decarboxylase